MIKKDIKIISEHGLHTRPAAKFVHAAQKFQSEILITSNKKSVNAKSLFKLQTLGLSQGTIITLSANGIDEKEAIKNLEKILLEME
ncbi:HPr family phosphocarrier protein [Buchnera aphidicola]|uniref:HPr family phosphocarrier protein n=1 Tax=Buchnera aphidicola TaxID=9 RepID=UPI003464C12E